MKKCTCAECDDFAENKPHIKPNKERYEDMLRAQGFGVTTGQDGVAEVEKAKKLSYGWLEWKDGMCHPHEDDLVDLVFDKGPNRCMVRAGDYNWSRARAQEEKTPVIAYYRPARLAELQEQKKEPVADADGWRIHKPEDKMPCDMDDCIYVMYASDGYENVIPLKAGDATWGDIVAWRPARQEHKAEEKYYPEGSDKDAFDVVSKERDIMKEYLSEIQQEAADLVEAVAYHLPHYYTTRHKQVKAFIDKCRGVNHG